MFTTQPETVYGVTFIAVGVDHDICRKLSSQDEQTRQELQSIEVPLGSRRLFNTGKEVLIMWVSGHSEEYGNIFVDGSDGKY